MRSAPLTAIAAFTAAVTSLLVGGRALAHTELVNPPPRLDAGCDGLVTACKTAPCGGSPMQAPYRFYKSNDTLKVTFEETIEHNGCFVVELSTTGDDKNFKPMWVQRDTLKAPASMTATIPLDGGVDCKHCTLRVRQMMMTTTPANCDPNATPNQGTYYQCADIQIGAWPDAGPSGGDDGGTTTGGGDDAGGSGDDSGDVDASAHAGIDAGDPTDEGNGADLGQGGGGCSAAPGGNASLAASGAALALGLAAAIARRRRRRARR